MCGTVDTLDSTSTSIGMLVRGFLIHVQIEDLS